MLPKSGRTSAPGGAALPRLEVEIDGEHYRLLLEAAQRSGLPLEEECRRSLEAGLRRSSYMEARLAELRAADQPTR
ncbi:hypothetical protein D9M68_827750 [compost metagenome]